MEDYNIEAQIQILIGWDHILGQAQLNTYKHHPNQYIYVYIQ